MDSIIINDNIKESDKYFNIPTSYNKNIYYDNIEIHPFGFDGDIYECLLEYDNVLYNV